MLTEERCTHPTDKLPHCIIEVGMCLIINGLPRFDWQHLVFLDCTFNSDVSYNPKCDGVLFVKPHILSHSERTQIRKSHHIWAEVTPKVMAWQVDSVLAWRKNVPSSRQTQGTEPGRELRLHFSPRGPCIRHTLTTVPGGPAAPHDPLTNATQPQRLKIKISSETTTYHTASQSQT